MFKFILRNRDRNKLTEEERQVLFAMVTKESTRIKKAYMKSGTPIMYKRMTKLNQLLEKIARI